MLAATAVTLAGAVQDGGAGRPKAPPLAVFAPPPRVHEAARVPATLARRHHRRALDAFAARLIVEPQDVAAAANLVEAGRRAGDLEWVDAFVQALRRRHGSAALRLAAAETAFARGHLAPGLRLLRVARRQRRGSTRIRAAMAAGHLAEGQLPLALAALGGGASLEAAASDLGGRRAGLRLARISLVLGNPEATRRAAYRAWRAALRGGDGLGLAEAEMLTAAVAATQQRVAESVRAAERAAETVRRFADRGTLGLALGIHLDAREAVEERSSRILQVRHGSCRLLPVEATASRLNCGLAALRSAWQLGDVATALHLYDGLQTRVLAAENPLLVLQLAEAAGGFLHVVGEHDVAARVAEAAVEAAGRLNRPDLRLHQLARLASARRAAGDPEGARRAAAMAAAATSGATVVAHAAAVDASATVTSPADGEDRSGQPAGSGQPAESAAARLTRRIDETWLRGDLQASAAHLLELLTLEGGGTDLRVTAPEQVPGPGTALLEGPPAVAVAALRGAVLEAEDRPGEARRAYTAAAAALVAWAGSVREPALRASLLDAWRGLHRRLTAAHLAEGDVSAGLHTLEASRGGLASGSAEWPRPQPGELLLAFGEVGGSVHVWGLRGDLPLRFITLPTTASELDGIVELWRLAALGEGDPAWSAAGARLAELLVGPLVEAGWLHGIDTVVVVPDGSLHDLSIPAAVSSGLQTGALVADVPLPRVWSRVPSLRVLAGSRAGARHPEARRDGGVVAFAPGGGTASRLEALRVVGDGRGEALLGSRATESRWRRTAATASVVHFAGHAARPRGPYRGGWLELRGDGFHDGRLTPREIVELDLDGAIVVLLGCETAARPRGGVDLAPVTVPSSLGEAFLAAGARVVVGNLWPLTEEAGLELATELYDAGGPEAGAGALATARERLRRRWPDAPWRWAGAVWMGAPEPVDSR